jgi:hypothetical protein
MKNDINITDSIRVTIDRFPKSYIFTYNDFLTKVDSKEAIIKALNRMVTSGKIAKISKGRFYKPEVTVFGTLEPSQYQIVKDLLEDDKKRTTGYLTGFSIYNQLGLTTQVSNTIQIGKNQLRPSFNRGIFKISFVKQKNVINKENIPFLQILDSIRYIKKIPDAKIPFSCKRLIAILSSKTEIEISTLVRLSLNYPPATRALLGAMLEENGFESQSQILRNSLNFISTYEFKDLNEVLSNTEKWKIK